MSDDFSIKDLISDKTLKNLQDISKQAIELPKLDVEDVLSFVPDIKDYKLEAIYQLIDKSEEENDLLRSQIKELKKINNQLQQQLYEVKDVNHKLELQMKEIEIDSINTKNHNRIGYMIAAIGIIAAFLTAILF